MMYPGVMPDYMGWMMIGSYVFWAVVIVVCVYAIARFARPADSHSGARSILENRLARGEINEDEFRSRLAILQS